MPWWRHQIETFSALLAICAGNSPVFSEFPTQRPVTRSFDIFFDLRLNKRLSWVNNRDAGDLRRYRAHYDVTVMAHLVCHHPTYFPSGLAFWVVEFGTHIGVILSLKLLLRVYTPVYWVILPSCVMGRHISGLPMVVISF